jgi:uncharacterized delta-60 repeat protein
MANAQSISLDPTFGQNGMTVIPNTSEVNLIDFDKQGNIIAVGQSYGGSVGLWHLTIVKTNADGIIDLNFGIDGVVKILEYRQGIPYGLKITNENKILVFGQFYETTQSRKAMLMQFNENGSVDESFGEYGKVIFHTIPAMPAVNLENDDFMLIETYVASPGVYAIAKYNYRGEIDESFGENGIVTLTDNATYRIVPFCIKILRDQSIIVAGGDILNEDSEIAFCKLNINGDLITDFANNGIWKMNVANDPPGLYMEKINGIIEESNGNFLLVGNLTTSFMCNVYSDGTTNSSFGNNGIYHLGYFDHWDPRTILQAGNSYLTGIRYKIISVKNDGTSDINFNNTGSFTCEGYSFQDLKWQEANKLILVGSSADDFSTGNFSIVRLNIPHNSILSYQKSDDMFTVFPNPVKDYLYFDTERSFEIIDILGKIVLKSEKVMQVNVNHLKAGVYFIRFEDRQARRYLKSKALVLKRLWKKMRF